MLGSSRVSRETLVNEATANCPYISQREIRSVSVKRLKVFLGRANGLSSENIGDMMRLAIGFEELRDSQLLYPYFRESYLNNKGEPLAEVWKKAAYVVAEKRLNSAGHGWDCEIGRAALGGIASVALNWTGMEHEPERDSGITFEAWYEDLELSNGEVASIGGVCPASGVVKVWVSTMREVIDMLQKDSTIS